MFRIDTILGRDQPTKTEKIEIKFAPKTDVKLNQHAMDLWRDGDMSFTDLLKGLMQSEAADEQLRGEFAANAGRWLNTVGEVTRAAVKFDMLRLFEKESPKTFMLLGDGRVYERVARELVVLMGKSASPQLAKVVATYCSQGKLGGGRLLDLCFDAKVGERPCVAVFQQLVQIMAFQALQEYEEVIEDECRDAVAACIRENRFMDIDGVPGFHDMLVADRYDYFAEPDAGDKRGQLLNCVDAYVLQGMAGFLGLARRQPKDQRELAQKFRDLIGPEEDSQVVVQKFFEEMLRYPVLVQLFRSLNFEGAQYKNTYLRFEKSVEKFAAGKTDLSAFEQAVRKLPELVTGKALAVVYEQTKDASSDGKLFMQIMKILDENQKIAKARAEALCMEKVKKNVSYGKFI